MGVNMNSNKLKSYFLGLILGLTGAFSSQIQTHCYWRDDCVLAADKGRGRHCDRGQDIKEIDGKRVSIVPYACRERDFLTGELLTYCCLDTSQEIM
jgi:hypothetical protein